ncbi:hypothetical protein APSETT445_006469 [Aspergillus pseudonomiae]
MTKTPIRTFVKSQLHQLTYTLIHIFFGIVVRLAQSYHAVVDRVFAIVYYHHRTPELIRKDVKNLDRLPEHLSVILSLRQEEDSLTVLMDEVAELAAWSVSAGIPVLSIYEKSGASVLYKSKHSTEKANTDSLTVLLLSATDGRETFVDLTKTLAEMSQNGKISPEDITMELVDAEISEITTQPSQTALPTSIGNKAASIPNVSVKPEPDLLLVFRPFLKLDGYPPWHIRLTEMYCTGDKSNSMTGYGEAVEYQGFLRGLWHYAGAQMRFGR